ncbi:IS1182 family transposase [Caballeronia zhejiangensis]|uniref:IS1182 family transposase n=1 Tax=Caballeronia zhejiangensis TaxID=871203 RepID=UPI001F51E2C6|nr:IS1182 family transposase [Caballeronia zhejiangensis]MCI1047858.1 IS1182 family transposase [Caballeronia zhejiangensis]
MSRFVPVDRQTGYLLPPSVEDWLPEEHLARFVVEVIEQLDLSNLSGAYAGRGMAAHHPEVLLGLLVYGYASGVFSSRKIERATYDSVAFRYIAANTHPDHDTLASFRKRFASQIEKLFVQVLLIAKEMKLVKLGRLALDGTKVKANASKHRALSYGHIGRIEAQLREEVQQLMGMAENADRQSLPDGMDVPAEIARREARLKALAEAKAKIEARAQERFEDEQKDYEAKVARREAQRRTGKKPRGKDPKPPKGGAKERDQINLTDEESRIMPVSSGGFEQGYNAQAAVDVETMLIMGTTVTRQSNDKRQVAPMLDVLGALPESLGEPDVLLADAGYFSAANVALCEAANIEPLMAIRRDAHHFPLMERFADDPAPPASPDQIIRMTHQLKTKAGRSLYGLRKSTVEPVFGIIKHVMGFRQFSLRGLTNVTAEWSLVALAWNIKRMSVLRGV